MNNNHRILVFGPNWIGDVIFTTPIFKAIKEQDEKCFLGCIIPKSCRDILENNPYIDEIIEFNERVSHRSLLKKISFVVKLRSKHYDIVILLHRSLTRTLICYLSGIKSRAGYAYKKRAFLLTKKIPTVNKDSIHKQDYYLNIARSLNIEIKDKACRVYCSNDNKSWADRIIESTGSRGKTLIAISPVTNWPPKNWPEYHFKELIKILMKEIKHTKIFITSKDKLSGFLSLIKSHNLEKIVDLTGKTNIGRLAALYEKMDVVVSGDSGPLHLAGAVNTKYVGMFGPTSPSLTGPRAKVKGKILFKNNFCPVPCYVKDCPKDFLCMKVISPREAADAVIELIG